MWSSLINFSAHQLPYPADDKLLGPHIWTTQYSPPPTSCPLASQRCVPLPVWLLLLDTAGNHSRLSSFKPPSFRTKQSGSADFPTCTSKEKEAWNISVVGRTKGNLWTGEFQCLLKMKAAISLPFPHLPLSLCISSFYSSGSNSSSGKVHFLCFCLRGKKKTTGHWSLTSVSDFPDTGTLTALW